MLSWFFFSGSLCRREAQSLKEPAAELSLENRLLRKSMLGAGDLDIRGAREKLEIIRLVKHSHLPMRRTLATPGIPSTTFCRWYDRFVAFGFEGLQDRTSGPGRVWNRIPGEIHRQIVELALSIRNYRPGNWRCGSSIIW